MNNINLFKKQLYYRSVYRGCKESDYVLTKFVQNELENLDNQELMTYSDFLNEDDAEIMSWVMQKKPFPNRYNFIMLRINSMFNIN